MPRSLTRIPRPLTALAVAAMLGFGAHAAMASPAASICSNGGTIGLSCTVGPTGDAYCDTQCKQEIGPESAGECFRASSSGSSGCCLCLL